MTEDRFKQEPESILLCYQIISIDRQRVFDWHEYKSSDDVNSTEQRKDLSMQSASTPIKLITALQMIKPEGHTSQCACVREYVRMSMCVRFTLPIIFYAAACQTGWGNSIMYGMLLEFILCCLSCIKYELFFEAVGDWWVAVGLRQNTKLSSPLLWGMILWYRLRNVWSVSSVLTCLMCRDWHENMHTRHPEQKTWQTNTAHVKFASTRVALW